MSRPADFGRREFLALGFLPFFLSKHVSLAGARFRIRRNGHSKRHYLLIHGNEETARQVLVSHIRTYAGVAYEIENHTRNVKVGALEIDPNRMFSRVGAEASLKRLNPNAAPAELSAALTLLDRGRESLVRALFPPSGGLVIALHNNSSGYSVADEAAISDQTSLREPLHPHAFFLCTDAHDYDVLKQSAYNVVLQKSAPKQDDGSLSRLAAARNVRYVNLEVALGRADRQIEMLEWLEWVLPE
jgi:hypothetical protein